MLVSSDDIFDFWANESAAAADGDDDDDDNEDDDTVAEFWLESIVVWLINVLDIVLVLVGELMSRVLHSSDKSEVPTINVWEGELIKKLDSFETLELLVVLLKLKKLIVTFNLEFSK